MFLEISVGAALLLLLKNKAEQATGVQVASGSGADSQRLPSTNIFPQTLSSAPPANSPPPIPTPLPSPKLVDTPMRPPTTAMPVLRPSPLAVPRVVGTPTISRIGATVQSGSGVTPGARGTFFNTRVRQLALY